MRRRQKEYNTMYDGVYGVNSDSIRKKNPYEKWGMFAHQMKAGDFSGVKNAAKLAGLQLPGLLNGTKQSDTAAGSL